MSAADKWQRVDSREFLRDVERARSEPFRLQPHNFQPRRRLPYLVCKGCGLVRLRNLLTAWAEDHGCNYARHPAFPVAIRRLS